MSSPSLSKTWTVLCSNLRRVVVCAFCQAATLLSIFIGVAQKQRFISTLGQLSLHLTPYICVFCLTFIRRLLLRPGPFSSFILQYTSRSVLFSVLDLLNGQR